MTAEIPQAELNRVRDWAQRQLAGGRELPWRAFLLTRLGETIDALLGGMAIAQPQVADAPAPVRSVPRLVVSNPAPEKPAQTAQRRPKEALRSGRLTKALAAEPIG